MDSGIKSVHACSSQRVFCHLKEARELTYSTNTYPSKSIQQWLEDTGTLVSYDSQDRSCMLTPSPEPVKVGTHDGISNSGSNLVL